MAIRCGWGFKYMSQRKRVMVKRALGRVAGRCWRWLPSRKTARVLMYHSISDDCCEKDPFQLTTPLYLFEAQMRFLMENQYHVVSCGDFVDHLFSKKPWPEKTIALTFDDGFRDNLKVIPVLEKYGLPATIFVAVDFIENDPNYLDWSDLRALSGSGLITIGSHTKSHRNLRRLDFNQLRAEISDSKKTLEYFLGRQIDLFAYPFGSYGSFDERAIGLLKSEGYRAAFTNIAGECSEKTDPYHIRRTRVSWFDHEREFPKLLEGAYDWYRVWQRLRRTPKTLS